MDIYFRLLCRLQLPIPAAAHPVQRRFLVIRLQSAVGRLRLRAPALQSAERPASRHQRRAGLKLEAALDAFGVDVRGLVALDSGLSTGGFADCLLQRGAARVYGVDVGFGQASHGTRVFA